MQIRELDAASEADWDEFVERQAEGTFFHRAAWRHVIEKALGHRTYYFYVEEDGRIVGILPLTHVKSRFFGNALVSVAPWVYGGPLAANPNVLTLLDGRAMALAEEKRVDYIEYRNRSRQHEDWPVKESTYAWFTKEIDSDPDVNMKAVPRKQRAMIRKGLKNNLAFEIDDDPTRLYDIYAESVRNLGTPVFSRKLFFEARRMFPENCEVLTVLSEGRPVSSVMSFYFRDEVLPYFGGGLPAARRLAAYDFMYWQVMSRAAARGCRIFDYGRSKVGSGSYAFKKHWGFEPRPLYYEYSLHRQKELPQLNPSNPKFAAAIAVWKRLPLAIANRLGPFISRNLG